MTSYGTAQLPLLQEKASQLVFGRVSTYFQGVNTIEFGAIVMLTLYHTPLSINSRRVWVALLEKHLSFETVKLV